MLPGGTRGARRLKISLQQRQGDPIRHKVVSGHHKVRRFIRSGIDHGEACKCSGIHIDHAADLCRYLRRHGAKLITWNRPGIEVANRYRIRSIHYPLAPSVMAVLELRPQSGV